MPPQFCVKTGSRIVCVAICLWLMMPAGAAARTPLNPNDPVGFFSTPADKMLWNTFGFGVTNGCVNLQFSGCDALSYELQQSSYDLVNWTAISTNTPVQGSFNVLLPFAPGSSRQFYRPVLLP